MDNARGAYADAGVEAELAPFFRDIASRLGAAHLVIGRSGASTVCELAVAGKPSVLIPLKIAIDDDQAENAQVLVGVGAAVRVRETFLTPPVLAEVLSALMSDYPRLSAMAAAARGVARPDAAERLADVVEETAG